MNVGETYNIHKKINCVLPFLKLKYLCKHGIHNFILTPLQPVFHEITIEKWDDFTTNYKYNIEYKNKLKCFCCGKEEETDEH